MSRPTVNFPNGIQHKEHPVTNHMTAAITRLQDSADDIIGWLSDFQEHDPYGNDEAITFHRLNGSIDLRHAIEEIIPHIRAMIAEEIRAEIKRQGPATDRDQNLYLEGLGHAARIAKGPQQ